MSTTANDEKPFKTTLLQAVDASDECIINGEDAGFYGGGAVFRYFEIRESVERIRYDDQEILVCNGKADFRCTKNKLHEIVFLVTHHLTLNDIILNRLTT